MIIDLTFASGDLRIRTRSTPAVRHAVELARAVLALGDDGHLSRILTVGPHMAESGNGTTVCGGRDAGAVTD
jgi:hypothetical protein